MYSFFYLTLFSVNCKCSSRLNQLDLGPSYFKCLRNIYIQYRHRFSLPFWHFECVFRTFPSRLANGVLAFSFAPFCSVFNKKERLYH